MAGGNSRKKAPPQPPVSIREMELDDLPAVYALGERLFTSEKWPNLYRTWDEYELVGFFAADSDTCLVADIGDDIAGFILGTVIDKRKSAWSYGYVVWLGVDPNLGRRGVASKLLERLTQIFVDLGVRILMSDTDAENEAAIAFFQRQGFGNMSQHVYMTKNLQQKSPSQPPKSTRPRSPGPAGRSGRKRR